MPRIIDRIAKRLASKDSRLKKDLRMCNDLRKPHVFISQSIRLAIPFSLGMTLFFFFVLSTSDPSPFIFPIIFVVSFVAIYKFSFLQLKSKIVKRQKEIDREVLFAGQYLLIKLYSGKPLLNALIETTKSYGVASKYIREIVDDIDTGSSLEKALSKAMKYSPSQKFRKILFQINNALKLGIDVTEPLRSVLNEITKEQEIEIKKYGRTLSSIVIFYMLAAIVVPSIGMTVFIVISSFISFDLQLVHFFAIGFFMIVIELIFMALFRSIRPTVNL